MNRNNHSRSEWSKPLKKWVLPETFVRYGHCAPRCFPSYKI
uniref:Uncharacterized protein n=1 Tax=Caudovirales sp. ctLhN17 TaxID=2825764 RepID=A0A8S5NV62_9CAUD|nr:MAG TPA: hypothetical protein [Caudovirales sp. ctLhN17]